MAAQRLQQNGCQGVFDKLLKLINDLSANIREAVAFTLGQFDYPKHKSYREQSIKPLLSSTKDKSSKVRAAAVSAFGHLCIDHKNDMPSKVAEAIVKAAKDPSKTVRSCAAFALGSSRYTDEVKRR